MWVYVLFYRFSIQLFGLGIQIVSLWNNKAKLWIHGRKQWQQTLQQKISSHTSNIWIHCASLGEFEQARPIIEAIKQKYPNTKIVLTFFSPSGYEVQKNYANADIVMYLPLDTSANAKKFIQIIQPRLVIFIKYEFWYEYLNTLHQQKIPTLLVSALFQKRHIFFKWYGYFFRKMLKMFNHFFVQNETSQKLLHSIHINNVSVSGDTRFDRVANIASKNIDLPIIEKFCNNRNIIVCGSTWPEDEAIITKAIAKIPELAWIIAPHELKPFKLGKLQEIFPNSALYSTLLKNISINSSAYNYLIIDNVGLLSNIYYYATIVYIGGGFGKAGIHNILEPAAHNKPIIFGPIYYQFAEAEEMLKIQAAITIKNENDFIETVQHLLNNKSNCKNIGEKARSYVQNHIGATAKILNYIEEKNLLSK